MSEIWWNLSGTDKRCDSYWAGHWVHWIQHKKSVQDPAPGIPVSASVDGDGVVVLEGPGVLLVSWNHRPGLVRAALERSRGFARWKPRWHISLSLPNPSSAVRAPCSAWRPWTKGENATFIASPTLTT